MQHDFTLKYVTLDHKISHMSHFKVVHLCLRLRCIHSKKEMFYMFMVGNLQNIFMEHDPYNVLLAIATNTPVLLLTGFVIQGHIYKTPYILSAAQKLVLL